MSISRGASGTLVDWSSFRSRSQDRASDYRSRNITWDWGIGGFSLLRRRRQDGKLARGKRSVDEKRESNIRREFAMELSQKPTRNYSFANDKVYVCTRRGDEESSPGLHYIDPSPRLRTSPSDAFPACTRRPLARGRISPGKAERRTPLRADTFPSRRHDKKRNSRFCAEERRRRRRRRTSRSASENVVWRSGAYPLRRAPGVACFRFQTQGPKSICQID